MKKTILFFLVFLLASVTIALPTHANSVKNGKQEACLTVLQDIESYSEDLAMLMNSYNSVMSLAENPFHSEYKERYLELADGYLESIKRYTSIIKDDLKSLLTCSGLEELSYEQLNKTIFNLYSLMYHDFFMKETFKLDKLSMYSDHMSILHTISKISESEQHAKLLDDVLFKFEHAVADVFVDGLSDKFLYRYTSYEDDNPTMAANIAIFFDSMDTLGSHIKQFVENYNEAEKSRVNISAKQKLSTAGITSLKSISLENITSMGLRAVYYGAYSEMFTQYSDPSQAEFRDEMAQNFASISVSTTPIAFAAAVGEASADMYDHVGEELEKINGTTDKALQDYYRQRANQKIEMMNITLDYANQLYDAKFNTQVTNERYVQRYNALFDSLSSQVNNVYQLDTNEVKIYVDGIRLHSPEAVYTVNGTTMVPLRVIAEALNITPVYNSKTQEITITNTRYLIPDAKLDIVFKIGSKYIKRGKYTDTIPVAPTIKNGVTFMPLRAVAQELALEVHFDKNTNTILLTSLYEHTKIK